MAESDYITTIAQRIYDMHARSLAVAADRLGIGYNQFQKILSGHARQVESGALSKFLKNAERLIDNAQKYAVVPENGRVTTVDALLAQTEVKAVPSSVAVLERPEVKPEPVPTKTCSVCHLPQPATIEFFRRHPHNLDGLHPWCIACDKLLSNGTGQPPAVDEPTRQATPEIPTKTCTQCGEPFPKTTDHFYMTNPARGYFSARCKGCEKKYQDAYRLRKFGPTKKQRAAMAASVVATPSRAELPHVEPTELPQREHQREMALALDQIASGFRALAEALRNIPTT